MGPQIDEIKIGGVVYIPKPRAPTRPTPIRIERITMQSLLKSLEARLVSGGLSRTNTIHATYLPRSGIVIINLCSLGDRFWKIFKES